MQSIRDSYLHDQKAVLQLYSVLLHVLLPFVLLSLLALSLVLSLPLLSVLLLLAISSMQASLLSKSVSSFIVFEVQYFRGGKLTINHAILRVSR